MTSAELKQIYDKMPIFLNGMFASDNQNATKPMSIPSSESDSEFNYVTGFPEIFSKKFSLADPEESGKRVLLKDMNSIGIIGSTGLYEMQHGGIYQYDPRVAEIIGGYAQGAILDYWDPDTKELRKIICTKDGGDCITDPSDKDLGVFSTSVDKHWTICDTMHNVLRDSHNIIYGGASLSVEQQIINTDEHWDTYKDIIIQDGRVTIPFYVIFGNVLSSSKYHSQKIDQANKGFIFASLGSSATLSASTGNIDSLTINGYTFISNSTKGNVVAILYKDENGNLL